MNCYTMFNTCFFFIVAFPHANTLRTIMSFVYVIIFIILACSTVIGTAQSCASPSDLAAWFSLDSNINNAATQVASTSLFTPAAMNFVPGAVNNALKLNSTTGYFRAPNLNFITNLAINKAMTACFWFKTQQKGSNIAFQYVR